MNESTLFGAPLGYSSESLSAWIHGLEGAWTGISGGRPVGELTADLEQMRDLFAHGSQGKKFRDVVARLPPAMTVIELPQQVAVGVDGSWLLTPEGRILLEVLHHLRRTSAFVIEPSRQLSAMARATDLRATWFQSWVNNQLGGPLSPASIAAAVLLLVNGSLDFTTSFWLPNDETARPQLRGAVLAILGDFSEALGEERPANSPLRSHWTFTQVSRVLSRDIERASSPDGARLFVRRGREAHLLDDLRERLAKHRPLDVQTAVDGLIENYRSSRGVFVSVGVMNERPNHTRLVVEALTLDGSS